MRAALLSLAALSLCASAHAEDNSIRTLEACVVAQAERLEASREAADVVADAAVAKCGKELTLATPEVGLLRNNIDARMQLKAQMRETALVRVVDIRTDRVLNPPPPPVAAKKPKSSSKPKTVTP